MTAKEYQRQYGRGRTPEFCAKSDAATAKAQPRPAGPSPTNRLTQAILSLLAFEGCQAWRQNNGAVYDASFGGYRANSVTPGISDILGFFLRTGHLVAVEVKVGKDELTPEQTEFLARIRAAGGFACEGRDVTQVRTEFLTWRQSLPRFPRPAGACPAPLCQT